MNRRILTILCLLLIFHSAICFVLGSTVFQEIARTVLLYNLVISIVSFPFLVFIRKQFKPILFFPIVLLIGFFMLMNIRQILSYRFKDNADKWEVINAVSAKLNESVNSEKIALTGNLELVFDYNNQLDNKHQLSKRFSYEINCSFKKAKIFSKTEPSNIDPDFSEELIKINHFKLNTTNNTKLSVICFKLLPISSNFNLWKNRTILRRVGAFLRFRDHPTLVAFEYEGTVFNSQYRTFKWVSRMNEVRGTSERKYAIFPGAKIIVWG